MKCVIFNELNKNENRSENENENIKQCKQESFKDRKHLLYNCSKWNGFDSGPVVLHDGREVGRPVAELGAGEAADRVVEPSGYQAGGRDRIQKVRR